MKFHQHFQLPFVFQILFSIEFVNSFFYKSLSQFPFFFTPIITITYSSLKALQSWNTAIGDPVASDVFLSNSA